LEVNNPTSSPPVLSNDALPHSTLPTTTPAAVLRKTRKRKSGNKTKKQKTFIASDDEGASESSPSDADSAHSSNGDGDDNGNNDDDAEPLPHSMRRRSNWGSASVAAVPQDATSPVNVDSLQETISITSPTRLSSSRQDNPSVSQPAHAVSSPVHSSQPTPPIVTCQAIIVDDSWLDWLVKVHEHLTGPDLGPAFDNIISKYITFEKLAGFTPARRNTSFGSKNRPSQVAWWVGCGRKATPKITDVQGFAKQWWLWWKGLQPMWRNVAAAQGPLTLVHRTVAISEGGWVDIE